MLHHLLFVASPAQIELTKKSLARLKAVRLNDAATLAAAYQVKHPLLGKLVLNIYLLADLDAITPHLRQNPVDLLIYDERGGGSEARAALARIRDDVTAFAELWGPDFLFPMSRVVAILQKDTQKDIGTSNNAVRAFELGRVQVRDVCIAPTSTAAVLRWLARILTHGVMRDERVGMALSGGGMEGFLYQIGVLHALHKALSGRSLRSIQTYTGVSSGSIAATIMAADVPTSDVIKAMHSRSEMLKPLTGSLLFDLAGRKIGKRILLESLSWAGLDPSKWTRKILQAIPTGFFKGDGLRLYFKQAIETFGHKDAFASLNQKGVELYIGATDQDSFEHVTFGKTPWVNVPISEALRASCALPPFFTPAQINNRYFIDGQVTKTVNLELVVERGCRLIFIIDPLKPLASLIPGSVDRRGGVFSMIQTVKALVHTRFQSTLLHMTERYPDIDFLVFQPDEECAQLMGGSPMRYRIRTQIVTAAYRHTLSQLRERYHVYSTKLGRYGFVLRPPAELRELEQQSGEILEAMA